MNTDLDIDINTMTATITCILVEARADLGITQKELASATGISLKTIANIESKQHIPSLLYAMRIADFFHWPGRLRPAFLAGCGALVHYH